MTESQSPPKKTRWGCLAFPIALTAVIALGRFRDIHYENQPLEVHLRDIFKESGFQVPEDATDLTGEKGFVDFQGDFAAHLTFSVKEGEVGGFLNLDPKYWDHPGNFQPVKDAARVAGHRLPSGTYMISQDGPGEYRSKYAVDPKARRIYFERGSW